MISSDKRSLVLIRSAIATLTAASIIGGMAFVARQSGGEVDDKFLLGMSLALLPTIIYLVRVKSSRRCVVVYGLILLGITLLAWLPLFFVRDAMRGVLVPLAGLVSLCTSFGGAVDDHHSRRMSERQVLR